MNGVTYLFNQQRELVIYDHGTAVTAFTAGDYCVHAGVSEPVLLYVPLDGPPTIVHSLAIGASLHHT